MSTWSSTLDQHADVLPGGPAAAAWRKQALDAFEAQGLPRAKAPAWKHTPLKALKGDFALEAPAQPGDIARIDGACHLVFVGGILDLQASDELPKGVSVLPMHSELDADGVAGLLDTAPESLNAPFHHLNTAFVVGGSVIQVRPGAVVDTPIVLVHTGGTEGHAHHVQHHVHVGRNAQLTLVELWNTAAGLANTLTTADIADNAELHHVVVQDNGNEALFLADQRHVLHRDARLRHTSVSMGSVWARNGLHARLQGPGAECTYDGVYLGRGEQHHDHTLRVEHAAPHCTSVQRYRGILGDRSRGVFSSLLVVTEDGVKTDGTQDNRNVLLSERAHADSEPMLEIYTDDVKAAHGTAIGKLDETALFYLRSRGIPTSQARRMLTAGVAREVIADIANEAVREHTMSRVEAWLEESVS